MKWALLALTVALAACRERTPPPPPPPAPTPVARVDLVAGALPPGPEANLALSKCQVCHTSEYITMQRLTPGQWEKTVAKMKKWGAPITDDEEKALVAYFAKHWTPDLPERQSPVVAEVPRVQ